MCLTLTVQVPAARREALLAAIASLGDGALHVELSPEPSHARRWLWARERDARASISESGGCACSLLADDADWNAGSWSMRPEVLAALARTLEVLASTPGGVVIEALWVGDEPTGEVMITPQELAALALGSGLGTRTRYVVSGGPGT